MQVSEKTREQLIKEQIVEENYRELVEQTNSIILRWDKKGNITFLNNFGLNFFGYSANEILGRNVVGTIVPETDRSGKDLDIMIQNIFAHPKLYLKNQNENIKSNGERVWISWTNKPIYDEDGALKEILSIGNDHTELKNAEEELRKTKEELEMRVFERTATLQKTSERLEAELVERKKTEVALEESRNLLKVILESLPVGILYVDREERIVLANRIFTSWWGKPDEDLAGHTVEDIIDQHYHAVTDSIQKALDGQETSHYETVKYKDGVVRDVKVSYHPDVDYGGSVRGFTCLVEDVTELRLMEKALRENQDRLELAMSGADMGTWDLDLCSGVAIPNGHSLGIGGYSIDDIEPTLEFWQSLIHPDDLPGAATDLLDTVEGRKDSIESVYRVRSKSGEYRWLQSRGKVVERDIEGKALRLAGTFMDITNRKKAEKDLKESEGRSQLLIEESPVGIAIIQHFKFTYVNDEFLRIFGYGASQEVIGLRTVDLVAPEFREFVFTRRRGSESGKHEPRPHEIKGLRKDGQLFDLELWTRGIDYEGKRALLAFCLDKSESKSLKDQLSHAQKMEAVGTLAGGIAHDFNNLLQIILGYTELLIHRDQINDVTKKDLARIMTAAENGADLVHMLMTFSRKTVSKLVPTNLNQRIDRIRTLLSRTIPKMIEIKLVLNDRLSMINADPAQLDQILMNLAVNARDAMPDGGRLVLETDNVILDEEYCRGQIDANPGNYVLLKVSDTGFGIDKDSLEHIFEPFFTTKGLGKGTGLGLAMVFGILKQHCGHIKCYSQPGVGTTFNLYFPSLGWDTNQATTKTVHGLEMLGGRETLLLADDERNIRDLCEEILVEYGYNVITASDGLEALEIYSANRDRIDVVILDVIMPRMDGMQCLNELLRIDPGVRVIMASGCSMPGQIQESSLGLIKGTVLKPYKAFQLLQTIRSAVDSE